jgi:SAM-dependent methyltransferase
MAVAQFTREYTTVRRAEGWGSPDGAYYRALPFQDLTGRNRGIWRIRAKSYTTLLERVLEPMEQANSHCHSVVSPTCLATHDARRAEAAAHGDAGLPAGSTPNQLRILDLGAGNGWLSNRLAERGHWVTAVDLLDDPLDGLGAARHYAATFAPLLAEFDHLPLASHQLDLAIFNASLHYSVDCAATLKETLRVLHPRGTLVILDSPMYSDPTSGARMVQERQARFLATYGFASDALPSEHFLTSARLEQLAAQLELSWQVHQPALDWRSRLGRTLGGMRARREPARFPVIVGRYR